MKLDPLIIRFTKEAKEVVRQAAAIASKKTGGHVSMNAFVIQATLKEAKRLLSATKTVGTGRERSA